MDVCVYVTMSGRVTWSVRIIIVTDTLPGVYSVYSRTPGQGVLWSPH